MASGPIEPRRLVRHGMDVQTRLDLLDNDMDELMRLVQTNHEDTTSRLNKLIYSIVSLLITVVASMAVFLLTGGPG